MIPNYYCNVCGAHGNKDNLLNIISIETDEHKYYYFCDGCADSVLDNLSKLFVKNSPSEEEERMTYQRYKELKGE